MDIMSNEMPSVHLKLITCKVSKNMSKNIESILFRNREPLLEEDLSRLTLSGFSGAFRESIRNHGLNPEGEVFFGTQVMMSTGGIISGFFPVKCGNIPSVTLSIKDLWDDYPNPGKVTINEHDASIYTDINGQMTSQWTVEVPWKVKVNIDGKWRSVKKGNLRDAGLSELCFRMNVQAVSSEVVKCIVIVVPSSMEELTARGDAGGRFFPGIKVTEVRGKLFPQEEPHHKFGVAVQPVIYIENAEMDEL